MGRRRRGSAPQPCPPERTLGASRAHRRPAAVNPGPRQDVSCSLSSKATLSPGSPPAFPAIKVKQTAFNETSELLSGRPWGNFYAPQLGGLWSQSSLEEAGQGPFGTRASGWSARHWRFPVLPEGAVLAPRPGSVRDPNRPRQGPPPEDSHAASTAYTPRAPVPLSAPTASLRGSWPPTNGHTLAPAQPPPPPRGSHVGLSGEQRRRADPPPWSWVPVQTKELLPAETSPHLCYCYR